MLLSLSIKNFTIVSSLELDFTAGMSAFTGETGAGKSIMIDALMLVLGERADVQVIRPGADCCEIHALFSLDQESEPSRWLITHDVQGDNATEVWLRRVITTEGRSKSYINGHPLPLTKIKELSELLVDIHGQHQHQRLLHPNTHRQQLDEYAQHTELLDPVAELYHQCHQLEARLSTLSRQLTHTERAQLLRYQIDELTALNLRPGELQALHQEHQLLHHAKDHLAHITQIQQLLSGEDEHHGVCQQLHSLHHLISTLPQHHPRIANSAELINNALIQCEEVNSELAHFAADVQLDPERLHAVEKRMEDIHDAARKYHQDPNQLLAHLEALCREQQQLADAQQQITTLQTQLDTQRQAYQQAALALRHSRQQHASELADEITRCIQQLGMPQGLVTIQFTPLDSPHAHGLDKIEYVVCTNPGLAPDVLAKIASGGELSRISLSIQLITARRRTATPTLIFDEVDVGIGGATAALVGKLLRQLGEHLQVFCVTHQPQVASAAHHHFLVAKTVHDHATFSEIKALDAAEKINEIARMLGGLSINQQTRLHAQTMLEEWS
jgi:DNA repair protein RecN (Recombination protein N)